MAKIKHPNPMDSLYDLLSNAVNKGVAHLIMENKQLDGRILTVQGKEVVNFTSYSYMGLELHPKVKEGAINAALNYGCMFPSSRVYLSSGLYEELEGILSKIFNASVIVTQSTTLAHMSVIPAMITARDMVIMDQQVHHTVQTPMKITKLNGTRVEITKHNDMEKLEEMIVENLDKYERVWYAADSIYSMFGDLFPAERVIEMLDKYENFYVYLDDAHGMSWVGENGKGWGVHHTKNHKKIIVALSLSKGFGACGGAVIFSDPAECHRVKTIGGNIIFTGPMSPQDLGASIASAKIHLTEEITHRQNDLKEKIRYFNELLLQTDLPLIKNTQCPIFFIGTGLPRLAQNVVKRMLNRGYFINIAMYPAVPINCTGLRISITTHLHKEDLKNMVSILSEEFPKAMEEENRTYDQIYSAFRNVITDSFPQIEEKQKKSHIKSSGIILNKYKSITQIDKNLWNTFIPQDGTPDWDGMRFIEDAYNGNEKKEHNWKYLYYTAFDKNSELLAILFFTECLIKDDMLSPASVSRIIEDMRKDDPYLYTTQSYIMGTSATEGSHGYINRSNPEWKKALEMIFDDLSLEKDWNNISQIILRDFESTDKEMKDFLLSQGFFNVQLPEANLVDLSNIKTIDSYYESLSPRNKKHLRKEVLSREELYYVDIIKNTEKDTLQQIYDMYLKVKYVNYDLNIFSLPFKFIEKTFEYDNWEILVLKIKNENNELIPIAFGICYFTEKSYVPLYAALDYDYLKTHENYRQLCYQAIKRAIHHQKQTFVFGYSATIEKRKFGAVAIPKFAYFQTNDTFKFEKLANMAVTINKEHYRE